MSTLIVNLACIGVVFALMVDKTSKDPTDAQLIIGLVMTVLWPIGAGALLATYMLNLHKEKENHDTE